MGCPQPNRIVALAVRGALILALATAVAQFVDYGVLDLRVQALNSNTHDSIFGAVSLLANAVAVVAAFLFAQRMRAPEQLVLACALGALLVLRVAAPDHVLVLSLPLTGVGLVILWRQARSSADNGLRAIRAGGSLLVVSFVIHTTELRAVSAFGPNTHSWAYQVRCVLKHDAELAGWILVAAGLVLVWAHAAQRPPPEQLESRHARTQPASLPPRAP